MAIRLRGRNVSIEEFRRQVDFLVEVFELDPKLPEILDLKKNAERYLTYTRPMWYLRRLNPHDTDTVTFTEDRVLIVHERVAGYVLNLWSIARYHWRGVDRDLTKIVVDHEGTHLYDGNWKKVIFRGGAIDAHRLRDPGNKYELACGIIEEFTGVTLAWREFVGKIDRITVTKGATTGRWDYVLG